MQIKDQLQRKIEFSKTPQRIISLVPSQTELLVDLGLKDQLVGVTKFCVHPENIRKEKQIVGGTKQIKIEKIKALNPDIILCNKEENTKEIIAELESEFNLHISDIYTVQDVYELISQYGKIFQVDQKAAEINKNIQKQIKDFQDYVQDKPVLKVAYFIWRKPWMVVGKNTFINTLLKMNKLENVYENISRYPEIKLENIKETDFILLSSEPYPFKEKHIPEVKGFSKNTKFALVDGEFFSWYGSRLEKAFRYFKNLRENELSQ